MKFLLTSSGICNPSISDALVDLAVTPYNCDAEFNLGFVPDGSDMAQGAEATWVR